MVFLSSADTTCRLNRYLMRTRGNSEIISPSSGISYAPPPRSPNQLSSDEDKEYAQARAYTCVFYDSGVLYNKKRLLIRYSQQLGEIDPRVNLEMLESELRFYHGIRLPGDWVWVAP